MTTCIPAKYSRKTELSKCPTSAWSAVLRPAICSQPCQAYRARANWAMLSTSYQDASRTLRTGCRVQQPSMFEMLLNGWYRD